jgi:hypothetical protein
MPEVIITEISGRIIQSVLAAHTHTHTHTHTQMHLNLKMRLVIDNNLENSAFDWFLHQAIEFCSEATHTLVTW